MRATVDLVGRRFGRLVVLQMIPSKGNVRVRCACDCGKEVTPLAYNLKNGGTTSCGCLWKEKLAARAVSLGHANRRHGMTGTRTYVCWQEAKKRCHSPNHTRFLEYGARGIAVCERWRDSFENFLEDMGECPPGMTLERRDNSIGYEPGNCEWATRERQAQNRGWNKMDANRVREMRARAEAGESIPGLAVAFGTCESNARLIIKGKTWKNVS